MRTLKTVFPYNSLNLYLYARGRLHAVIVCVWCGSMRAHCCAVRPNREWGGRLGVGPHVAVTVSTVTVTYDAKLRYPFGRAQHPGSVQRALGVLEFS